MKTNLKMKPIAAILLTALGLAACSQSSEPKAETSQSNASDTAAKTYQIGSDMTFPPFEYMENDQPAGFDVDLAAQIFAKTNEKANFVDTRFSNLITGLDAKKFDLVLSGLYITKERLEKVDMVPYYMTTEAVIALAGSDYQPKVRDDLCGKTVASQKGSLFPEQLRKMSEESCVAKGKAPIKVREFETSPESVQALLAKAVDAQYDDASVAKSTVDKLKGRVLISSTEPFFPILGGIAVRKGDTAMLQKVQSGLDALKASGEYGALIAKYNLQEPTDEDIAKYMPK
ncbi:ABC transporter substrate-binding protein [Acinetobacter pragensis]|uniref:Amino acid ABC transporter substrate-binding protein n=1 Tax=Acinetobacter pragensis TaxID=1806892 RepID=A0A151Y080_9GAMM|nr:ABC transporter substrate-binding protein [Acinetobacter pragensis]KYQ71299.1 amino acid ABC transporter substrate-binding protein [Acinetobacter pragensis]